MMIRMIASSIYYNHFSCKKLEIILIKKNNNSIIVEQMI